MEMNSTHNKGKSVVAVRFIRTLKNKIYKYMTLISQKMCIDKLDDIVNKYSNIYHKTIKMKHLDLKTSTYIDFKKKEDPKFLIMLEYQNIKASSSHEEIFEIKKVKNILPLTYIISNLNGEEIVGTFIKNDYKN